MARVYERGGRWYYEYRRNGRQVRRSTGAKAKPGKGGRG
jgi:hypothetical protein